MVVLVGTCKRTVLLLFWLEEGTHANLASSGSTSDSMHLLQRNQDFNVEEKYVVCWRFMRKANKFIKL